MRNRLSDLLTREAKRNQNFYVLSGDHGYALLDSIRESCPAQFYNVGVAEQNMVGMAAGLARMGFRPFVYGLAAFIPMRVLEQIKLDICYSNLPVVFLGDGAGVVYSTLGASHQCAEDIACLRPLPEIRIFSPGTPDELEICFEEAMRGNGPSYIRLGKCDLPVVGNRISNGTEPYFTHQSESSKTLLITTGSLLSPCTQIAQKLGLSCLSIPRIKPFPQAFLDKVAPYSKLITAEEHSAYGGLFSSVVETLASHSIFKKVDRISLQEKFSQKCGTYQFALSEHGLDDESLFEKIKGMVES